MGIKLNASLIETLFQLPDGHSSLGYRKVGVQLNGYGQISMNCQTGEAGHGQLCTLVLEDLDEGRFWGVDFGASALGEARSFPWRPRGVPMDANDNLLISLVPLDKVVTVTYQPRRRI